ncbi:MAG: methyltransferase domain-containing protein [Deltaproteobacteria bacterium]|nr:methyltransferase domain-containing protein [Deltaproteobacteria bacterium]
MELRARVVEGVPGGALTLFELADVDAALDDAIRTGGRAPYGGVLWDAAPCLAAVLLRRDLAGRRVVELGCGLGLVALACARAGAQVLATDVDETALQATRRAAAHAGLSIATGMFDVTAAAPLPKADVVVAADLLYEPALAAALARRAREGLAAGACVVIGDPGRVGRAAFAAALGAHARFEPVVVGEHTAEVLVLEPGAEQGTERRRCR